MKLQSERFTIDGPAGVLEVRLDAPEATEAEVIAVVCHPHPQYQGTMLNKVVHMLSRACTDLGVHALRFNYRGVGHSAGSYDDGVGETADAVAALDFMRLRHPGARVILAGFSFGSGVALRVAREQALNALVTAAPPVGRLGVPAQAEVSAPWLVLQGTDDELVDSREVAEWVNLQSPQPQLVMMEGVSHFFHGNLVQLRERTSTFLREVLAPVGADSNPPGPTD